MDLLAGYFRNHLDLQNLATEVELKMLAQKSTGISNGLSFSISSGTIILLPGTDVNSLVLEFSPSASVVIPQASNLSVSLSSTIDILSADEKVSDTSLYISADIISGNSETRKINLLKAERNVLEAQRDLQNGFLSAEKEFYTNLRSLYLAAASITKAEKDLYDDQISFDEVKARGFTTSSSRYRAAQMAVLSDEHTIEISRRELEREIKIFASKCGVDYNESYAMDFLPADIPMVEAVDVLSFESDSYTKTERALWTRQINEMTRSANKSLTLSAGAGFTLSNDYTKSDTIDAGTNLTWNGTGLMFNTVISVPVAAQSAMPALSFGVSADPNAFRLKSITERQEDVERRQEEIAIQSARNDYATQVIAQQTSLEDIRWSKDMNTVSYQMYSELEADNATYYERGIITESEWRNSQVNKENYRIQCIINDIDLILYNDTTCLLFCRDEELKTENLKNPF
ncbi:MAG: hypothetical protein J1F14_08610 [Treponema sp.]|nr:hypothetical protein [Treponema sp.]